MLGFWHKLRNGNNNKISCILYKMLYDMHMNNYYSDEWILKVQNILNECGLYEYWTNPDTLKEISFVNYKKLHTDKLANMYKDKCTSQLQASSKCSLHRNFKDSLTFEKYLVGPCNATCKS